MKKQILLALLVLASCKLQAGISDDLKLVNLLPHQGALQGNPVDAARRLIALNEKALKAKDLSDLRSAARGILGAADNAKLTHKQVVDAIKDAAEQFLADRLLAEAEEEARNLQQRITNLEQQIAHVPAHGAQQAEVAGLRAQLQQEQARAAQLAHDLQQAQHHAIPAAQVTQLQAQLTAEQQRTAALAQQVMQLQQPAANVQQLRQQLQQEQARVAQLMHERQQQLQQLTAEQQRTAALTQEVTQLRQQQPAAGDAAHVQALEDQVQELTGDVERLRAELAAVHHAAAQQAAAQHHA